MGLNERILRIINEKGLKQNVVARKIGKNANSFNWMLHNAKKFDGRDIAPLCEALNVTPNELFGYKNQGGPDSS